MADTPSLFDPEPEPGARPAPTGPAASPAAGRPRRRRARDAAAGTSPMMQQYFRAKKEAGDALLFFRMGDFYELFYEDARLASRVLGITLTSRAKDDAGAIPMAGVPYKAYTGYLHELVQAGYRVALCDQVQDPRLASGLVERRLTRIVTAGTVYEDDLLQRRTSNYLLAVAPAGPRYGLAWIDVSTGVFQVQDAAAARLADEVSRLDPAEIVLPETVADEDHPLVQLLRPASGAPRSTAPEWTFDRANALEALTEAFGVRSLEGFGLEDGAAYVSAAGAVLSYVKQTHRGEAVPASPPRLHDPAARAGLDRATRSCLEVLATQRDGRKDGSLLGVMDASATPMGARLLREWLVAPLVDVAAIQRRQSAVDELCRQDELLDTLGAALGELPDVERIATRLLAGRGSPRDLGALRAALRAAPRLREALQACASAPLADAAASIEPRPELLDLLERGLAEPPPATLADGGVIATGFDAELDRLRGLKSGSTQAIARFQAEEAQRVGLPALKVGFNRVFGYYIEITHAQAAHLRIPDDYLRKQTLSSAERYFTPRLKELESALLEADERARALEAELYASLRERAAAEAGPVRDLARAVGRVDVLVGFARLARERGWVRPVVDDGDVIDLKDGRHPVLEARLPAGQLVPNDACLDRNHSRLVLVTGPNMAGKSTYIRQVAVLVLMAQVGSFVPATSARVGVVDRIFTRVGASDDLAAGVSTFMMEMTETAAILHGATQRSLVILDEVGRGTSTWDGLSLAWAISEYLYRAVGARTLFATHYHELVDLAEEFGAVRNVNVSVREWGEEIVFLHKIVPGGSDRSYGLHVARLAGLPAEVVRRAQRILADLESRAPDLKPGAGQPSAGADEPEPAQHTLFPRPAAAVLDELSALDPDLVSPLDALLLLRQLHEQLAPSSERESEE